MSGKTIAIITAIVLFSVTAWLAEHYRQNVQQLTAERDRLNNERTSTARILSNQQQTFHIMNAISAGAENDKRRIQQDSDTRIQAINQTLAGQQCADKYIPDTVSEQLLNYATRLRADTVPDITGKSDSTDRDPITAGGG
ncbi:hypothetical protein [Brenneria uluponensis]|uniref:hypothetical protein n=1 Tax=Brenneria uluponensis TaxID=3057057 RepID=UPI0028EF25DD|nr:hypothetical protein [Brenneria ulupoensis]